MLYLYNMSAEQRKGQHDPIDDGIDEDLVFKALAAPVRRRLLDELKDRPRTTGDLCATFSDLDRCTVMQHLRVLEDAQLVIAQRRGRERWNHLSVLPIQHIHDRWIGDYARSAVQLLDRLAADLATDSGRGT